MYNMYIYIYKDIDIGRLFKNPVSDNMYIYINYIYNMCGLDFFKVCLDKIDD